MRAVSAAKAKEKRARSKLVGELADAGVRCEIGPYVSVSGCTGQIGGLHERRKRSSSGSVTVGLNLVPACNACNGWIEDRLPVLAADDPEVWGAILAWLVVRSGDPDWDACGVHAEGAPLAVAGVCERCGVPWTSLGPYPAGRLARCGHFQ